MTQNEKPTLDLEAVMKRLESSDGKQYWRSLEELAAGEGFQEMLQREFPRQAGEWTDPVTRRKFLTLMGASLALAGLSGCRPPGGKIVPNISDPEGVVPGKPLFYATAMPHAGYGMGLLAESNQGRPTKVEGNPEQSASQGATDVFAQASVLGLYDPDREAGLTYLGQPRVWDDAVAALRAELTKSGKGKGVYLLTETITSPTLLNQLENEFLNDYPEVQWVQHEPAASDTPIAGAKAAFGVACQPVYAMAQADVIFSLDADFLSRGPGHLRYTRDFSSRRNLEKLDKMNRLYAAESVFSNTGIKADNRLGFRAVEIDRVAQFLAFQLKVEGISEPKGLSAQARHWLTIAAEDLASREKGKTLVIAGDEASTLCHALAALINDKLGNAGKTVHYIDPVHARPGDRAKSLRALVDDMTMGKVQTLVIVGANPVYTAGADIDFKAALDKVPTRFRLGLYHDETSRLCHWHIPDSHYLESWGDVRAFDGTATIIQPLIAPLFGGGNLHDLFADLSSKPSRTAVDLVKDYWKAWFSAPARAGLNSSTTFEKFYRKSLHDGVVAGTNFPYKQVKPLASATADAERVLASLPEWTVGSVSNLEITFRPDEAVFDGRFANNGWLLEMPKSSTKITWDNAAIMSLKTALELGVALMTESRPELEGGKYHSGAASFGITGGEHGRAFVDTLRFTYQGRTLVLPVWVVPGHPDYTINVQLGYGRERAGKVGTKDVGADVYKIRVASDPWSGLGVKVERTGKQHILASTQAHHYMEGRNLVRSGTAEQTMKDDHWVHKVNGGGHGEEHDHGHGKTPLSILDGKDFTYKGHKWGMVINLTACTGCSACVVACQAENNIPVVGKLEVTRGREMHWIRIDRYFEGNPLKPEELKAHYQPLPCMQCENAPCEQVCPVAATAHSYDGLNDMVYNRCVGTRYCSNNCPYKVRRFNFLQYTDYASVSLKMVSNPEVTVRTRGVMEKCTYCVQRIRQAEVEAEKRGKLKAEREGRALNRESDCKIQDGEVLSACQAVCPAGAILFGDLNDPKSKISQARAKLENLNYSLLDELNTSPRTTYLAEVRNPNPKLVSSGKGAG
ncbi:MAG: 4Fe-4S dicluster domain-containing protein [Gemmataceae bacterium]|nr:4Fe-4S dicluster domain-containing protein [Gemmataceae bacterium]